MLGHSSHSSHRSFLPTVFSAPSLWAPESEASRTVTSLRLYTNSCVFLLLFTAKGASPSILPAPRGLGGSKLASLVWEHQGSESVHGEHPGGAPNSWVCFQSPPPPPHPSLQCPSSHAFPSRGIKGSGVKASHFRLSEITCQVETTWDGLYASVCCHLHARPHMYPSTPHCHQGPTNARALGQP